MGVVRLGERAESWRQRLIDALALVEAGIDFSDEADVPQDMMVRALELIRPLADEIGKAFGLFYRVQIYPLEVFNQSFGGSFPLTDGLNDFGIDPRPSQQLRCTKPALPGDQLKVKDASTYRFGC